MPTELTPITTYASLDLIPKPREYDVAGLTTAQTVKNLNNDNLDVFIKLSANSVGFKVIFFYPDATNGCWYLHPDNNSDETAVSFATNKGRSYSRYLLSSALLGSHFGIWLTSGSASDIDDLYVIPCRRGGGLR